jgi:hypothetical protein
LRSRGCGESSGLNLNGSFSCESHTYSLVKVAESAFFLGPIYANMERYHSTGTAIRTAKVADAA